MNTNPTDFIRRLKSIRLPSDLKARLRADLSAYADLHTVRDRVTAQTPSPFSVLISRTRGLYAGALALVLILAGGTQASFASEGAKPGDLLYTVKVAVAEPIAFTLAASSERKAELAARFASRRVNEAAALSNEGRLDGKTADELAARFDTHVDALAKETEALEAKGDIAVSLAVRTDLEQKLSASVEGIAAVTSVADVGTLALAKASAPVEEAPEDRFNARVTEKSRTLATTRERLDSALALDTEADGTASTDLALLRQDGASMPDVPSARLFFAKAANDVAVSATMLLTASSTATSTPVATTTATATSTTEAQGASLFFGTFMKR